MTARSTQGWAGWGIAALAAILIAGGLALGGGPVQARKERRDDARVDDIQRIAGHITCLVGDSGAQRVPDDLAPTPECPGPVPLVDIRGGEPYRIEQLDDGKYRICAAFELPPEAYDRWYLRLRDGNCILQQLPQPVRIAPALPPDETLPGTQATAPSP